MTVTLSVGDSATMWERKPVRPQISAMTERSAREVGGKFGAPVRYPECHDMSTAR